MKPIRSAMLSLLIAAISQSAHGAALTNVTHVWQFETPANPISSSVGSSPGLPLAAAFTPGRGASGWIEQVPLGNVGGVWDLGGSGALRITGLGTYSMVTQVTVRAEQWIDGTLFSTPATTSLPGATLLHSQTSTVQTASLGSWKQFETTWLVESELSELSLSSPSRGTILNALAIQFDGVPILEVYLSIKAADGDEKMIQLSWPSTVDEYVLEKSTSLDLPGEWQAVGVAAVQVQGRWIVNLDAADSQWFYRLRKK